MPASGPTLISRLVAGSVYETVQLPVLARSIRPRRGDPSSPISIGWAIRIDRVAGNAVTDPKQLVGMTARRPLRANQMLRMNDVAMAPAIHRGTMVTLMVQTENMTLTAQGRALEDAAVGQPVRVINTMSNKSLTAW